MELPLFESCTPRVKRIGARMKRYGLFALLAPLGFVPHAALAQEKPLTRAFISWVSDPVEGLPEAPKFSSKLSVMVTIHRLR